MNSSNWGCMSSLSRWGYYIASTWEVTFIGHHRAQCSMWDGGGGGRRWSGVWVRGGWGWWVDGVGDISRSGVDESGREQRGFDS
jgi:hypothetical protein